MNSLLVSPLWPTFKKCFTGLLNWFNRFVKLTCSAIYSESLALLTDEWIYIRDALVCFNDWPYHGEPIKLSLLSIWLIVPLKVRSCLSSSWVQITKNVERQILHHHSLSHPHVVQLEEVILTDDYIAVVMEYVEGGTLHDHLSRFGAVEEDEAR